MNKIFGGITAAAMALTSLATCAELAASPAAAQAPRPSCTGVGHGLTHDFKFSGTNFSAGKAYVVAITPPSAPTFYGVATADASGSWGEYWLPDQVGTYTANVYTYQSGTLGKWITSCSLVVG